MASSRETYAKGTRVPVERTKTEIERLLIKYKARATAFFANEDGPFLKLNVIRQFGVEAFAIFDAFPYPLNHAEVEALDAHRVRAKLGVDDLKKLVCLCTDVHALRRWFQVDHGPGLSFTVR